MAAPFGWHQVNMGLLAPNPSQICLVYCYKGVLGVETVAMSAAEAGDAPGQGSNDTEVQRSCSQLIQQFHIAIKSKHDNGESMSTKSAPLYKTSRALHLFPFTDSTGSVKI